MFLFLAFVEKVTVHIYVFSRLQSQENRENNNKPERRKQKKDKTDLYGETKIEGPPKRWTAKRGN